MDKIEEKANEHSPRGDSLKEDASPPQKNEGAADFSPE